MPRCQTHRPLALFAAIAVAGTVGPPAGAVEPRPSAPDPRDIAASLDPATSRYAPATSYYTPSRAHLAATYLLLQATLKRPRASRTTESTESTGPRFLSRRHLRQRLRRITPAVVRCLHAVGRRDATVTVRFRIQGPTGRVSRARVLGAFARSPVNPCVCAALRRIRFARFRQPSQWVVYPIIIKTRGDRPRR